MIITGPWVNAVNAVNTLRWSTHLAVVHGHGAETQARHLLERKRLQVELGWATAFAGITDHDNRAGVAAKAGLRGKAR